MIPPFRLLRPRPLAGAALAGSEGELDVGRAPVEGDGERLRVGVKKVGCSGFAYTYDYADEIIRTGRELLETVERPAAGRESVR